MKKIFMIASVLFIFSIFFTFEQSKLISENNAFADGTCCPEKKSVCAYLGRSFDDYYYRGVGSCASDPPVLEEVALN